MAWLLPTLGYVVVLGIWGVTGKLALRTLTWQDVLLITAVSYAVVAIALVLLGQASFHRDSNNWWALASAACVISALIFFYIALRHGDVSKVVPVSAAYPALALLLSAVFLSEDLSLGKIAGVVVVIGGVVLLSVSD
jgi:transporter family protein